MAASWRSTNEYGAVSSRGKVPVSLNTTCAANSRTSSAIDRRRSSVNGGKLAGSRCSAGRRSSSSHQLTNAWMLRVARGSCNIRSARTSTSFTVSRAHSFTRASRAASGSIRQMKRDSRPTISCGVSLPGSPVVGGVGGAGTPGTPGAGLVRGGLGGKHQAARDGQVGGGGVGRAVGGSHLEGGRCVVPTVHRRRRVVGLRRRGRIAGRRRPPLRRNGGCCFRKPPGAGPGRKLPQATRLASDASPS